jgi:hypothetical protein
MFQLVFGLRTLLGKEKEMFSHTLKRNSFSLLLLAVLMLAASSAIAQDKVPQVGGANVSVTASATSDRVRFAAPSAVVQLRLEVYDGAGQKLIDTEQRGGNVLDWHLHGGNGERVADGTYLFVVTIKNLSGRLSQKLGSITVSGQSTMLHASAVTDLNVQQAQAVGPIEGGDEGLTVMPAGDAQPVTVLANNAEESQLARTRGALTFRVGDFFSGNDKEQMRLTEAGNLGIGTSDPQAKLDVAGTIRAQRVLIAKPKSAATSAMRPDGGVETASTSDSVQPLASGSGMQNQIAKWTDNSGTLGNSVIAETAGGNVGIGTTSPQGTLHVHSGTDKNIWLRDAGSTQKAQIISVADDNATINTLSIDGASLMLNSQSNGNVGIGTTSPQARLDIEGLDAAGSQASEVLRIGKGTMDAGGDEAFINFVNASNTLGRVGVVAEGSNTGNLYLSVNKAGNVSKAMTVLSSGNIGVGTTLPQARLDVEGVDTAGAQATEVIRIGKGTMDAGGDEAYINFVNGPNSLGRVGVVAEGSNAGDLYLSVNNAGTVSKAMTLLSNGNVGIGKSNPQSKLDIAGDINVSGNAIVTGNIAAKYQDVAEWVHARQQIPPGTVVILDQMRANAVAPSVRAYDTLIAGVVSARPGLILGEAGTDKVMVATTGRVLVRVDARRHPIKIGDLLVTSSLCGVAMKSLPIRVSGRQIHRPGTIIGKALEALAGGEGKILVLLSLQ